MHAFSKLRMSWHRLAYSQADGPGQPEFLSMNENAQIVKYEGCLESS